MRVLREAHAWGQAGPICQGILAPINAKLVGSGGAWRLVVRFLHV